MTLLGKCRTGLVVILLALLLPFRVQAGIVIAGGSHLTRDGAHFQVKGMNYYPKDYAWHHFWEHYGDPIVSSQVDAELNIAKSLGVNTVRAFVPYNPSNPIDLGDLSNFIGRLGDRDMVAIITLFDLVGSASAPYLSHESSRRYIGEIIDAVGNTNPNVLAWDIKNELDRDYGGYGTNENGEDNVKVWVEAMIPEIRNRDPNHLVTIGFYGVVNEIFEPSILAEFAAKVDFLSVHYFLPEKGFQDDLKTLRSLVNTMPIVLEEFGLHTLSNPRVSCARDANGSACDDPHTEHDQAAYYNALLSFSEASNLAGYLFWTLNDFSKIVDGDQESHHCQGILRNALVERCEAGAQDDYTYKPAADRTRRHYSDEISYLDEFDGWVNTSDYSAPLGWSDNRSENGGQLVGYDPGDPEHPQISHTPSHVAFYKLGQQDKAIAASPILMEVDVDTHPFLTILISDYRIRDSANNDSDCTLRLGVTEDGKTTRLGSISPNERFPAAFAIDLRESEAHWNGIHSFQITLELDPTAQSANGYSATYELGWIALLSSALFDIDGDGETEALTDGVLIIRYLFGLVGEALIGGAVDLDNCTRCTFKDIEDYISDTALLSMDVDGNGKVDALSDGLLITRFAFGLTGAALLDGALDLAGCARCTAAEIEAYIEARMP